MPRLSRSLTLVASMLVAIAGLAACASSTPNAGSSSGPGGPNATTLISNLPDLGFKNVKTETAAARGAVITEAGGTITATGSNGAIYTLSIPRDAMPSTTQIAIYPITSVANLPGGVSVSAGVQITPDGIQLRRPATFTIQFPSGTDPKGLGGILWTGDADKVHPYPANIQGQTVTMHLFHFTAPGVTPDPLAPPLAGGNCATADDMESVIGFDVTIPDLGQRRNSLTFDLRDCYHHYVAPALEGALAHLLNAGWRGEAGVAEDHWLFGLVDAASAVGSQAFTVSPEVADAKANAITLVRAWYEAENEDCVAHKDDPDVNVPIDAASLAMFAGWEFAHDWGLDTAANGLDLATALNRLCVQVVIDPNRSYGAAGPGTTGEVKINVGITIAGGPLQFERAHVTVTRTGTGVASADGQTDAQGNFTATVPWPTRVDPIQLDILAALDFPGTEFGSLIARFDRITKHSGDAGTGPGGNQPPPTTPPNPIRSYSGEWQSCGVTGACFVDRSVGGQVRLIATATGEWVLALGCLHGDFPGQYNFRFGGSPASFTASGVGAPDNVCSGSPTVKGTLIGTTLTFMVTNIPGAPTYKFSGTQLATSP